MDESGQPGGTIPGENGNGTAAPVPRAGRGAWSPEAWSQAGAALEPAVEPVVPAWRRPVDPAPNGWAPSRYADLLSPPPDRFGSGFPAPVTGAPPASAPPYPYEGDLEDAVRAGQTLAPPDGARPESPPISPAPSGAGARQAGPVPSGYAPP
ncbi:MAG TPA: hypothetical protein VNV66_03705, partial [Pilimelia sp.]|nr:hypothetical protein [Pilimelia sp.]